MPGARLPPGGAQPEPVADEQRLVEVLPAVGPVVGDLGGRHRNQGVAGRRLDRAELGQLALGAVDRVLDVAGAPLLLDAVGGEDRELGQHRLRQLGPAADREPDQPNARRTREKKPPPVSVLRFSSVERRVEVAGVLALLLAEVRRGRSR